MPDEQPSFDPLDQARARELDLLYLLTDPETNQPLWTLADLARQFNERDITPYTQPLQRAGLIHITGDGHVFASSATVHFVLLVGHGTA